MTQAITITLEFPFSILGINLPHRKKVDLTEVTIKDLFDKILAETCNKLLMYFYSDTNEWSPVLSIFVNNKHIRDLEGENTALKSGDNVIVLFPYAGG
jgi:molybdopterin converting factor small subunit